MKLTRMTRKEVESTYFITVACEKESCDRCGNVATLVLQSEAEESETGYIDVLCLCDRCYETLYKIDYDKLVREN